MAKKINKNLKYLRNSYVAQRYEGEELVTGERGVALEGSSRSGKTISGVDFIILLCSQYETNCTINILKETFAEFKTTLYDDFKKRLTDFGLDNPFMDRKEVKSFKILGNKVNFIGCDKISKSHGASSDYLWLNEPLEISQQIFDQYEMRCRKFWWMDYNPSVTQHWIYETILKRSDVGHLKTTFLDNPFISIQEKKKILSYEPWQTGSYEVTESDVYYNGQPISKSNYPPRNVYNHDNGTADEFMWRVYGLGLRGAMKGVIFRNIKYIDTFPDIAFTYGLDFGFTVDPLTLVKYAQEGNNVYLELLCYHPVDNALDVDALLTSLGVSKGTPITADSSDRYVSEKKGAVQMVRELYEYGWEISKVSKTKGVMHWLNNLKQFKIHVIINDLSHNVKKEQENYRFKEVNGIEINQPIDAFNHFFDAARYAHMSNDINTFGSSWN